MDGPLKELGKLEKVAVFGPQEGWSSSAKSKLNTISESLDSLLVSLSDTKRRLETGLTSDEDIDNLLKLIEEKKKEIDERQKELHTCITRYGKALDKKFTNPLPSSLSLFSSKASQEALERTIALHFMRTGQFATAETFLEESKAEVPEEIRVKFVDLHRVLTALRNKDIVPALEWCDTNRTFLESRSSHLQFHLHRSQYIRLLVSNPHDPLSALGYARIFFPHLYMTHSHEISRLIASIAYLPLSRLQASPYADLASPSLHFDLEPMFAKEYCASIGMSRHVPLRVVGDIGGGGALARIEKGRKVMRERKSEWSQPDELPIEIHLSAENRYHSIFACPVSKEQATASNPPMMMACGHVVAKDSLQKLSKPQGRVKCPYCPQESQLNKALQVHF